MPKPCQEQLPCAVTIISEPIKQALVITDGHDVMVSRFQFGAIATETHHLALCDKVSGCQIDSIPGIHVRTANHPLPDRIPRLPRGGLPERLLPCQDKGFHSRHHLPAPMSRPLPEPH